MSKFRLVIVLTALTIILGWLNHPSLANVNWQSDFQMGMNMAKASNRLVFVEVSAEWCPPCRGLNKLLHDKRIEQFLDPHFVGVKLNADEPQGQNILRKYHMSGIPALLVFGAQGDLKGKMSGAPQDIEGFKHTLTNLAGGEAVVEAAGSSGSGGGIGNTMGGNGDTMGASGNTMGENVDTMGGVQNILQQFGNGGQGQPYQQQFQQQQIPNVQQTQGGYYQPQFAPGQQQVNYAQPQFQQQQMPNVQQPRGGSYQQQSWQQLYDNSQQQLPQGQSQTNSPPQQQQTGTTDWQNAGQRQNGQ